MRLAGKVALVTGAGSGIGRAIALAYQREGARVVAADRNGPAAESTAAAAGRDAQGVVADVSRAEDVRAMVSATTDAFGRLDVLVNSAAIQLHDRDARCHELSEEAWEETLRVNLRGPFLCMKYAIPALLRGGGGSIVNIASPTGIHGRASRYTAYSSSKGGLISLTRATAVGYAKDGIRVNAIVPGPTDTPLVAERLTEPGVLERIEQGTPLGRIGTPDDLTGIAVYLASDESRFATGSLFVVDGGWLIA
jgi:NAD(P)-dependent dehydrogenase (short-subunit alcohol dehydrogenase family)